MISVPSKLNFLYSLSATYLRNRIIGALRASPDYDAREASLKVSQEFVFENPTLQFLSSTLVSLIHPDVNGVSPASTSSAEAIDTLIKKYTADLPAPRTAPNTPEGIVVLLTGSTGALGSHILASLLAEDRVTKVYTFDRTSADKKNVEERQKEAFEDRGLDISLLESSKLSALTGSLIQKDMGLSRATFGEVSSLCSSIHGLYRA